ncbi:MAG: putative esterase [Pseudohongiellaceae bacterium]
MKQLIEAGVEPANITLIGFSRGAQITAEASSQLKQTGINTALMAFFLTATTQWNLHFNLVVTSFLCIRHLT